MTRRRKVILGALLAAVAVLLVVSGFFIVSRWGGPQTAQHPVSTPEVTAPAPSTATPGSTPHATPAPTPSEATLPGGQHQPVPQPVGSTQPVAQGLTMTVLGSHIERIPSPGDGLSEVVGIHVILHNPSAAAVTPNYQNFKLYAADGTVQGNQGSDLLAPVPAGGDLETSIYFHIPDGPGLYSLVSTSGSQWNLSVTA